MSRFEVTVVRQQELRLAVEASNANEAIDLAIAVAESGLEEPTHTEWDVGDVRESVERHP